MPEYVVNVEDYRLPSPCGKRDISRSISTDFVQASCNHLRFPDTGQHDLPPLSTGNQPPAEGLTCPTARPAGKPRTGIASCGMATRCAPRCSSSTRATAICCIVAGKRPAGITTTAISCDWPMIRPMPNPSMAQDKSRSSTTVAPSKKTASRNGPPCASFSRPARVFPVTTSRRHSHSRWMCPR